MRCRSPSFPPPLYYPIYDVQATRSDLPFFSGRVAWRSVNLSFVPEAIDAVVRSLAERRCRRRAYRSPGLIALRGSSSRRQGGRLLSSGYVVPGSLPTDSSATGHSEASFLSLIGGPGTHCQEGQALLPSAAGALTIDCPVQGFQCLPVDYVTKE
jgi:hypothetical protein